MAQRGDSCRILADRDRGERHGRSLAQEAAAHLVGDLGDLSLPVHDNVDDDAVAAQGIVAPRCFGRRSKLARTDLRFGECDDLLLVELVTHRRVFAACRTPVSSASMSVLSLYGAIETRVVPSRSKRSINGWAE